MKIRSGQDWPSFSYGKSVKFLVAASAWTGIWQNTVCVLGSASIMDEGHVGRPRFTVSQTWGYLLLSLGLNGVKRTNYSLQTAVVCGQL